MTDKKSLKLQVDQTTGGFHRAWNGAEGNAVSIALLQARMADGDDRRNASVANATRNLIDEVSDLADADTADPHTVAPRGIDGQRWFLKAHIQEQLPT